VGGLGGGGVFGWVEVWGGFVVGFFFLRGLQKIQEVRRKECMSSNATANSGNFTKKTDGLKKIDAGKSSSLGQGMKIQIGGKW